MKEREILILRYKSKKIYTTYPHMTTGKTIALTNMDLCKQSDVSDF